MQHHAYVIAAGKEEGIRSALAHAEAMLGIEAKGNPDVVILEYGLLTVEDARGVSERASGAPLRGAHKVIVIAALRAYHEAQNALLKLFEEPPPGTFLYLVLPSLGGLLPTLRSRVQELTQQAAASSQSAAPGEAFLKGGTEKRAAVVKKLTSGKDEDARRLMRDEAIALANSIEAALAERGVEKHAHALAELATLRDYLYDRSAPVKQILEHLAVALPKI